MAICREQTTEYLYAKAAQLTAITTIFKADNIEHAFDIARKQGNTLTAEEVATLMYNTIVTNYNVT